MTESPPAWTDLAWSFRAAWALGDPDTAAPELLPVRLARACVAVLPVAGAGLSLFNDVFRVPLGANDEPATLAERLQFTQGEGPCLDATRSGRIVVARREQIERRWPMFADALFRRTPYRSIIAVPLPLAAELTGALDLYLTESDAVRAVSVADVSVVTDHVVDALMIAQAISGKQASVEESEPALMHGPAARSRTTVWLAMGMIMTVLGVDAQDALARLRAFAFSHDALLDDIAGALVYGTLELREFQS